MERPADYRRILDALGSVREMSLFIETFIASPSVPLRDAFLSSTEHMNAQAQRRAVELPSARLAFVMGEVEEEKQRYVDDTVRALAPHRCGKGPNVWAVAPAPDHCGFRWLIEFDDGAVFYGEFTTFYLVESMERGAAWAKWDQLPESVRTRGGLFDSHPDGGDGVFVLFDPSDESLWLCNSGSFVAPLTLTPEAYYYAMADCLALAHWQFAYVDTARLDPKRVTEARDIVAYWLREAHALATKVPAFGARISRGVRHAQAILAVPA